MYEAPLIEKQGRFDDVKESFEQLETELRRNQIDLAEFSGHSSFMPGEIAEDTRRVADYERRFAFHNAEISQREAEYCSNGFIVEAALSEEIILGKLFGKETIVMIPSRYDDYFNHVDLIICGGKSDGREDGVEQSVFGLAIDFTSNQTDAREKLIKTFKANIMDRGIPVVKYGKHPNIGLIKNMKVAKVVVGAGYEAVNDVVEDIVGQLESNSDDSMRDITRHSMESHQIVKIIYDEIRSQLLAFRNIAKAVNNPEAAKVYGDAFNFIDNLLKENSVSLDELASVRRRDPVARALFQLVSKFTDPKRNYQPSDLGLAGN